MEDALPSIEVNNDNAPGSPPHVIFKLEATPLTMNGKVILRRKSM